MSYHYVNTLNDFNEEIADATWISFALAVKFVADNRLSDASKMTLVHQGGQMSRDEVAEFEADHRKDIIIQMRTWDEEAKDPGKYSDNESIEQGLLAIKHMLEEQMCQP